MKMFTTSKYGSRRFDSVYTHLIALPRRPTGVAIASNFLTASLKSSAEAQGEQSRRSSGLREPRNRSRAASKMSELDCDAISSRFKFQPQRELPSMPCDSNARTARLSLRCSQNATRCDCARCCRDRIPQSRPFATVIGSSTKMPRCQSNGTVSLPDTAPLANPRDKLVALSGLARRCVLIRVGRSVGSWNWYEYRGGVLVACSCLRNYSLILPECLISQINLISRKRLLSYASPSMIPSTQQSPKSL